MKRGSIYDTLNKVTRRLREEKIDYAVVGAMALSAHGFRRFTEDVDLLTTPEGLDAMTSSRAANIRATVSRSR